MERSRTAKTASLRPNPARRPEEETKIPTCRSHLPGKLPENPIPLRKRLPRRLLHHLDDRIIRDLFLRLPSRQETGPKRQSFRLSLLADMGFRTSRPFPSDLRYHSLVATYPRVAMTGEISLLLLLATRASIAILVIHVIRGNLIPESLTRGTSAILITAGNLGTTEPPRAHGRRGPESSHQPIGVNRMPDRATL